MSKFFLNFLTVFTLLLSALVFSQEVDKLYLSSAGSGRVYDITSLSATPGTSIPLPTPLGTPNMSTTTSARISNLAVGYDAPGGNPASLMFIHSNNQLGSGVYKNGAAVAPALTLPAGIGGIATNNVPGSYFGYVYGFVGGERNLYQVYPSAANLGAVTGDADWTNGTLIGTDTFFDYQNNIYRFVDIGGSRYLYKISLSTKVATRVTEIFGSAASVSAIQGMAYLKGSIYAATLAGTDNSNIEVRRISMSDGSSALVATYTATNTNLDLATVPYYVPFTFACGSIAFQQSAPYVKGVSSTRTLRIPISNVYASGTYTINVIGTDITNPAYQATITGATAFIDVPVTYNGSGVSGARALTIDLNGTTTTCTVETSVAEDSDGDGVPDYLDLDDDNDGILDATEMYCDQTIAPNGTFPVPTGPMTTPSYTKQLLFFDWSGVTLSPSTPTATKSVVHNGVTYTATISNYTSSSGTDNTMVGHDVNTYASGPAWMFWKYYNVNSTTFKEILYTPAIVSTTNKMDIVVTATKDGVSYPVDMVVFDPESTQKSSTESVTYTTNGSNFSLLEKLGTGTIGSTNITGAGTNTVTYLDTQDSGVNALFVTTGYRTKVTATVVNGTSKTKQGIGFAVRLFCDTDNDGIPDYLDLDSDNDGCLDAIEGSDNVVDSQLVDAAGTVKVGVGSTALNQNLCASATCIDAGGVPTVVNAGGAADTDGLQGQGIGTSKNASINGCICYNNANTATAGIDSKHGITLLQRAGVDNGNWPMVRKSAHTVLESNTKGLVITRMTTAEINAIASPQEGMMVYDKTAKCLKLYDGTAWKCFVTPACP